MSNYQYSPNSQYYQYNPTQYYSQYNPNEQYYNQYSPNNTLNIIEAEPQYAKELVLKPWQIDWANKVIEILQRSLVYVDTSRMGSGKTYVTLWVAKQLGIKILVVCPPIMIEVWRKTADEYGVSVVDIISYQSLRSVRGSQPKHGFLTRHDNVIGKSSINKLEFHPTQKLYNLCRSSLFIICDEIQNIKNTSSQYKACKALFQPIIYEGGTSRIALLSGTPFDKEEHALNLLKLISYIRSDKMFTTDNNDFRLLGLNDLIETCLTIDKDETNRIISENKPNRNNIKHIVFLLYVNVVKKHISGSMPSPTSINVELDTKNGFYNIDKEKEEQLSKALQELSKAVKFDSETGNVNMKENAFGAITKALQNIELSKVKDIGRVAINILSQNNENKVIISVNYNQTIEELKEILQDYNPLVLNGSIVIKKRGKIVDNFNNDPTVRVLIMNTIVGGVGISLHDTVGDSPRFMFISPSYSILNVTQAAGRIYRDGVKSKATVRMFYGKDKNGVELENKILDAMARKTNVLRNTLEEKNIGSLKFPGEYKKEIEDN